MKKILLLAASLLLIGNFAFAQGEKSLKMASKKFTEFASEPFSKGAVLEEAKALLKEAFEDATVAADPKAWLTKADIYYNSGDSQIKSRLLNPDAPFVDPNAGIEAAMAYTKALELAEKKGDVKNALKGLVNTEGLLNNMGIELYKLGEYTDSYKNFNSELAASALLKEKGEKSRLDDPALYNEKVYFAGLTAYYAEDYQASIDNLLKAKETGTDEPSLYQVIYESYKAMDKADDGLKYLEAGRAAFPEDNGLLFSEINHYLAKGELNKMIGKLEIAHEVEPDNLSVILTLGQVYDQLQVKANEAGKPEEAAEDFTKALKYYNEALKTVPDDFDLNYSIGALYYNKAAGYTASLNEVANDFSKAGEKKYEEIKATMASLFDQALPYFLKADSVDGSSRNTLIALKEIYARKDEFAKSNEYKERLENLEEN